MEWDGIRIFDHEGIFDKAERNIFGRYGLCFDLFVEEGSHNMLLGGVGTG